MLIWGLKFELGKIIWGLKIQGPKCALFGVWYLWEVKLFVLLIFIGLCP